MLKKLRKAVAARSASASSIDLTSRPDTAASAPEIRGGGTLRHARTRPKSNLVLLGGSAFAGRYNLLTEPPSET